MEVLALISGMQKGKSASLPSWVSLRDIQQHKTRWRCFVPKCLCVLSSNPLFETFRTFLRQLYRLAVSAPSSAAIEAFVLHVLAEIPLPGTNLVQTSFSLVDRACLLTGCAPGLPVFYPTEVDFTLLFQSLSPENIVRVCPSFQGGGYYDHARFVCSGRRDRERLTSLYPSLLASASLCSRCTHCC